MNFPIQKLSMDKSECTNHRAQFCCHSNENGANNWYRIQAYGSLSRISNFTFNHTLHVAQMLVPQLHIIGHVLFEQIVICVVQNLCIGVWLIDAYWFRIMDNDCNVHYFEQNHFGIGIHCELIEFQQFVQNLLSKANNRRSTIDCQLFDVQQ